MSEDELEQRRRAAVKASEESAKRVMGEGADARATEDNERRGGPSYEEWYADQHDNVSKRPIGPGRTDPSYVGIHGHGKGAFVQMPTSDEPPPVPESMRRHVEPAPLAEPKTNKPMRWAWHEEQKRWVEEETDPSFISGEDSGDTWTELPIDVDGYVVAPATVVAEGAGQQVEFVVKIHLVGDEHKFNRQGEEVGQHLMFNNVEGLPEGKLAHTDSLLSIGIDLHEVDGWKIDGKKYKVYFVQDEEEE